ILAARELLDRADQVVTVARLIGDKLEDHQAKRTVFEHPASSASAAAPAARWTVAEIKMEWTPIALPAASAAHGEQSFGDIELEFSTRPATAPMSVTHESLLQMCLRYISDASTTRGSCIFVPGDYE